MNKKFIEKFNLQEAVKRFQQINEYTFINGTVLTEEGDEDDQNNPQNNGQQPQDMQQGGADNAQMPPNPNGDMNNQQPPMNNDMGGQEMPMDNGGMGAPPTTDMGNGEEEFEFEEESETDNYEEGDEVIDIDDLTQSQEATEIKVDNFGEKFDKMLAFLDKVTQAIELSDKKIDNLRQEFERRNPTEEEKLNLRSQASYPYSETPKDYWEDKMANNPHYNVIYDNEVSTAKEPEKFEITTDDVENINPKEVADSFDINKAFKLGDFFNF